MNTPLIKCEKIKSNNKNNVLDIEYNFETINGSVSIRWLEDNIYFRNGDITLEIDDLLENEYIEKMIKIYNYDDTDDSLIKNNFVTNLFNL